MRGKIFALLYIPADLWIRLICVLTGVKCRISLDFSE